MQREGITGLYSGLDSALFGISVTNFVYYYCMFCPTLTSQTLCSSLFPFQAQHPVNSLSSPTGYEWTRAFFERAAIRAGRASKSLTTLESMLAGALAGSATVLITNPIWVVNTRMTARQSNESSDESLLPGGAPAMAKKPSTLATLVKLLRQEGPTALFAGVLPALVLVVNPILQYTIFEQLKTALAKRRRVLPRDIFILGALGKLAATSITYPYITVKSRMHVATAGSAKENMIESLRRIVREEGWKGLYKGKLPPSTFLSFLLLF